MMRKSDEFARALVPTALRARIRFNPRYSAIQLIVAKARMRRGVTSIDHHALTVAPSTPTKDEPTSCPAGFAPRVGRATFNARRPRWNRGGLGPGCICARTERSQSARDQTITGLSWLLECDTFGTLWEWVAVTPPSGLTWSGCLYVR